MHRVLVVDDDPKTRCELEEAGLEIEVASGAEDVLQLVSNWIPELVVLGIGPRDASGLQLLRRITGLDPHVLTVLVSDCSGYADDFSTWLADALVVRTAGGFELGDTVRKLLAERMGPGRMTPPCA